MYQIVLITRDQDPPQTRTYACSKEKCDSCYIKFRCFTQRGSIRVSAEEWNKVRRRLRRIDGVKDSDKL